eukprot:scaffold2551_cov113-Cylindrotheca_fusiformis.AAC.24
MFSWTTELVGRDWQQIRPLHVPVVDAFAEMTYSKIHRLTALLEFGVGMFGDTKTKPQWRVWSLPKLHLEALGPTPNSSSLQKHPLRTLSNQLLASDNVSILLQTSILHHSKFCNTTKALMSSHTNS